MESIVRACDTDGPFFGKIQPVVVISDRACGGLAKAKKFGVPIAMVTRPISSDGKELLAIIEKYHPEVVSQNGWLSKTPLSVIKKFERNIYNQHPAPLDPEHKGIFGRPQHFGGKGIFGKAAHASVLEFLRLSGRVFPTEASIHRVTMKLDEGEVVARRPVDIFPGDTAESLSLRMLQIEYDLQIEFLNSVYEGSVKALVRNKQLIDTSDVHILEEAKKNAVKMYPHG